jgi:hypothetical protein
VRLAELRRSVAGRRLCRRRFSAALLLDLARRRVAEDVSLEDAMGQLIIRVQTFFERVAPKHEPLARADSLIPRASATPADKKYGFTYPRGPSETE